MSYESNLARYIDLATRFIDCRIAPERFVHEYGSLWKSDRDEEEEQMKHWERRFDLELQAELAEGHITTEQFSEQWMRLWNITAEGKVLRNVMDRMFTTCNVYNDDEDRAAYELNEADFRLEIQGVLDQLQGNR